MKIETARSVLVKLKIVLCSRDLTLQLRYLHISSMVTNRPLEHQDYSRASTNTIYENMNCL